MLAIRTTDYNSRITISDMYLCTSAVCYMLSMYTGQLMLAVELAQLLCHKVLRFLDTRLLED